MLGQPSQLVGVKPPRTAGAGYSFPSMAGWDEIKRELRTRRFTQGRIGEKLTTIAAPEATDNQGWGSLLLNDLRTILMVPGAVTSAYTFDIYTETFSNVGVVLAATAGKWRGAALHPNGVAYMAPFGTSTFATYNRETNTFTEAAMTAPAGSGSRYEGIVLTANGKMYSMPHDLAGNLSSSVTYSVAANVLTVNFTNSGLRVGDMVGIDFTTGTAVDKQDLIVAHVQANLFRCDYTTANTSGNCAIRGKRKIAVVDPIAATASDVTPEYLANGDNTASLGTKFKSEGTVLGPGGREVFGAPLWANGIPVYDIGNESLIHYGDFSVLLGAWENKFRGGRLAWNDWIYFAPYGIGQFCKIHAYTKEIQFFGSFTPTSDAGYSGVVAGANGYLYCIPRQQGTVAVIDPATDTVDFITHGYAAGDNWSGSTFAPNGKIYCCPFNANDMLVIDTGISDFPPEMCASPYLNGY